MRLANILTPLALASLLSSPTLLHAATSTPIDPDLVHADLPVPGKAIDWQSVRREQAQFRAAQRLATMAKGPVAATSAIADIAIAQDGWYRISFDDLVAAGIGIDAVAADQVALTRAGVKVPLFVTDPTTFGKGSSIEFYGEAVRNSLYTETAHYRLLIDRRSALRFKDVGSDATTTPTESVLVSTEFAPEREYTFSAPGKDPWAAKRIVRSDSNGVAATESFDLAPAFGKSESNLVVSLWGGLDYAALPPDHSVRILLNGSEVARERFDGLFAHVINVSLQDSQLRAGGNELSVEVLADTGYSTDVVYLDSFAMQYERSLDLSAGAFTFDVATTDNHAAFRVANADGDVLILRNRGGALARVGGIGDADNSYRFAFSARRGDRVIVLRPGQPQAVVAIAPAGAVIDPTPGAAAQLLVIAHPSFVDAIQPLVEARRAAGISTRVIDVEALYAFHSNGQPDPVAIQASIEYAHNRLGTRYVLFVGDDNFDYKDRLGLGAVSFVPTQYAQTTPIVRFAPVDSLYGDVGLDGDQDVVISRMPARTVSELQVMVAKAIDYATQANRGHAVFATDRAQPGLSFLAASQQMQSDLGASWSVQRVDLDTYATTMVASARSDLAAALASGQSLTSYYGHGFPGAWGSDRLLAASDISAIADVPPTALVQFACWSTYFVDPRSESLAHALLANPGGVAVMIGQSALGYTQSNTELARTLLPRLATLSIGEALLAAKAELATSATTLPDVTVGALMLGDPTLQVRAP
ncbi:MAG: hypothetical protein IPG63_09780 [Xanthomonadales bacterium]|nr:hypothetical protein [Xanthomonadales bacterium]